MRLSHPIVFVVGIALAGVFAVLVVLVRGASAIRQRMRRSTWAREREERAAWARHTLAVDSIRRVTDDTFLVIAVETHDAKGLNVLYAERRRAMVRVPAPCSETFETLAEVPVLVAPKDADTRVVDFAALTGDEARGDELAAAVFSAEGRAPRWQKVA